MIKNSEIQLEGVKYKGDKKIELAKLNWEEKERLENLRHKHIMEEIEAMKKAKITNFVRQIKHE